MDQGQFLSVGIHLLIRHLCSHFATFEFFWGIRQDILYRKSDLCIPRNKTTGRAALFNSYFRVSVCDLYSIFPDRSAYLAAAKYADRSWEYINRSQIHECGNFETEHYNSVLEITRSHSFISGNT
jgi:hypothetical protein